MVRSSSASFAADDRASTPSTRRTGNWGCDRCRQRSWLVPQNQHQSWLSQGRRGHLFRSRCAGGQKQPSRPAKAAAVPDPAGSGERWITSGASCADTAAGPRPAADPSWPGAKCAKRRAHPVRCRRRHARRSRRPCVIDGPCPMWRCNPLPGTASPDPPPTAPRRADQRVPTRRVTNPVRPCSRISEVLQGVQPH